MKLLQDFIRVRLAGVFNVAGQPVALPRDFNVTVPAPLAGPAKLLPAPVELARVRAVRREPASFLKTSRHRRWASGR